MTTKWDKYPDSEQQMVISRARVVDLLIFNFNDCESAYSFDLNLVEL